MPSPRIRDKSRNLTPHPPSLPGKGEKTKALLPVGEGLGRGPGLERTLSFVDAVREATDQEMARDSSVIVFGLDVDDPKAIQGTTRGLVEKYGPERVFGTPLSEDAMTGAAIGMALSGLRPIHVHIRMDFLLLAMNQLVNVAAKSRYMYGGRVN